MSKVTIDRELLERVVGADASKGASATDLVDGWRAMEQIRAILAATQRQQGDERGHDTKGSRKALGAMNARLKIKIGRLERELAALKEQQAREVVMPERKVAQHGDVLSFQGEGWNACLDEFARLNKGGSHV